MFCPKKAIYLLIYNFTVAPLIIYFAYKNLIGILVQYLLQDTMYIQAGLAKSMFTVLYSLPLCSVAETRACVTGLS